MCKIVQLMHMVPGLASADPRFSTCKCAEQWNQLTDASKLEVVKNAKGKVDWSKVLTSSDLRRFLDTKGADLKAFVIESKESKVSQKRQEAPQDLTESQVLSECAAVPRPKKRAKKSEPILARPRVELPAPVVLSTDDLKRLREAADCVVERDLGIEVTEEGNEFRAELRRIALAALTLLAEHGSTWSFSFDGCKTTCIFTRRGKLLTASWYYVYMEMKYGIGKGGSPLLDVIKHFVAQVLWKEKKMGTHEDWCLHLGLDRPVFWPKKTPGKLRISCPTCPKNVWDNCFKRPAWFAKAPKTTPCLDCKTPLECVPNPKFPTLKVIVRDRNNKDQEGKSKPKATKTVAEEKETVNKTAGFSSVPEILSQTSNSIKFKITQRGVPGFLFEGIHYFVSTLGKARGFKSRGEQEEADRGTDGGFELIVSNKKKGSVCLFAEDWAQTSDEEEDQHVENLAQVGIKLDINWLDGPRKSTKNMTPAEYFADMAVSFDEPSKGMEFTVSFLY